MQLMEYAGDRSAPNNNILTQLMFFKNEMETDYPILLDELRSVPDTENGAYWAAYEMCVEYERPEDMYSCAENRGALAIDAFKYIERDCQHMSDSLCRIYMLCMNNTEPFAFTPGQENGQSWNCSDSVANTDISANRDQTTHSPSDVIIYQPAQPDLSDEAVPESHQEADISYRSDDEINDSSDTSDTAVPAKGDISEISDTSISTEETVIIQNAGNTEAQEAVGEEIEEPACADQTIADVVTVFEEPQYPDAQVSEETEAGLNSISSPDEDENIL